MWVMGFEVLELCQGQVLDGHVDQVRSFGTVFGGDGGAQLEVVVDDGNQVFGDLNVEFHHVGTVFNSVLHGSDRVLTDIGTTEKGAEFSVRLSRFRAILSP